MDKKKLLSLIDTELCGSYTCISCAKSAAMCAGDKEGELKLEKLKEEIVKMVSYFHKKGQ